MEQQQHSTKTLFAFLLILAAGVGLIATTPLMMAHALGVAHEKNFGQCKQDKNDNACRQVVKPGNG